MILSLLSIAFGQANIRSIDFKNFTYRPYCSGENTLSVRVKDGEYLQETPQDGYIDRFYFRVMDIAFGDLDSDGKEEAAIITVCNTGGTGRFTEGFIYRMNGGKPVLAARLPGGDRADGGLRSVKIENSLLVVEQYERGKTAGACCPEFIVTQKFKLIGKRLIQVGKVVRREAAPKQRVTFELGSNAKTVRVRIPAGKIIRLVLRAGRGQSLSVTTHTDRASVRITNQANVKI